MTSVVLDPVPPVASLSTKLNHLLAAMLEKDARHRPEWEALRLLLVQDLWVTDFVVVRLWGYGPHRPARDIASRLGDRYRVEGFMGRCSVVLDRGGASTSMKLNCLLAALLEKDARHRPEWEALRLLLLQDLYFKDFVVARWWGYGPHR